MPVHLDVPAPGMAFDPREFSVRGWLWLEARHPHLAAVEAWTGDVLLGECERFHARADVNTKYALPVDTCTAFEFSARHPTAAPGANFELRLLARLRNGTRTDPLFVSRVGPLPLGRDPRALLRASLPPGALGLEIGAHTQPTPGLTPFYTDSVPAFAGAAGRLDFLSDARALPLADDTLDYLCSSHVLEHLPDPLAALCEWHRVLRPGGFLYLVVPDQRFTFDAPRATTPPAHLLRDFARAATAATSLEHVDEFVLQSDWSRLHPGTTPEDTPRHRAAARADYLACLARGESVDIHFHTFTPDSLRATLRAAGFVDGRGARFAVAAEAERYPPERTDGIALLLRRLTPAPNSRPAPTATLPPPDGHGPALPLVDPVSLQPLPPERLRPTAGAWPDLLPPAGTAPGRSWSPAWRRQLLYRRAQLRLALSASRRSTSAPA
jgi:hypothetical protein